MLTCEPLCQFSSRLYFTTFPGSTPSASQVNRAAQQAPPPKIRSRSRSTPVSTDDDTSLYHYFTVDEDLTYLSFFEDWGPLNIAMVYRACIYIHELLEDETLKDHRLVLYASSEPRRKANAALIMALYVLIVLHRPPWEAFYPISELEFMPFRDAGRGRSDFDLSIHDCLWGFWKAQRNNLISMNDFSLQEYEFYEKVENGDWNWITPGFLAFASPSDTVWIREQRNEKKMGMETPSRLATTSFKRKLPQPFQNCLDHFEERGVKLVIRLNNPLYDKNMFEERGIEHMELYFDDGTNPTDEIVRDFIAKSETVFDAGGAVAIHCKAGLGRTGTLIGAYLIYKYDFTANEAIAFMRICRPGCVVGPQQQYLYQRQMEWVRWAALDQAKREAEAAAAEALANAPIPIARPVTPPQEDVPEAPAPTTPTRPLLESTTSAAEVEAMLPPGQPRKTPTGKRVALEMLGQDEEDEGAASDDSMEDVIANPGATQRPLQPITKVARSLSPQGKTVIKTVTAVAGAPAKPTTRSTALAAPVTAGSTTTTGANGRPIRVSPRLQGLTNGKATTATATTKGAKTNGTTVSSIPTIPTRRAREEPAPTTRTRSGTTTARAPTRPTPSKIPSRKLTRANSPPPVPSSGKVTPSGIRGGPGSRLPTLAPSKRTMPAKSHTMTEALPTVKNTGLATVAEAPASAEDASERSSGGRGRAGSEGGVGGDRGGEGGEKEDAWMSNVDAKTAVEPGTKSGNRPSITRVRRRRSSFSSVDIL